MIDGTGKHVSAGIIDEHSHIAAASINEGGQSVTSEVRIADNLNPDDINIYRQLEWWCYYFSYSSWFCKCDRRTNTIDQTSLGCQ